MGLIHPESFELWQEWSDSRHRARRAKHAVTGAVGRLRGLRGQRADGAAADGIPADAASGTAPAADGAPASGTGPAPTTTAPDATGWTVLSRAAEPLEDLPAGSDPSAEPPRAMRRLLIAVDSASPTSRAALLASLPYLRAGVDVLMPAGLELPEIAADSAAWTREDVADPIARFAPGTVGAVVSIGQHLRAGAAAHRIAQRGRVREDVIQHGALTPYAPPLPEDARLLAWSEADGEFWRSEREDVGVVSVGSQLLWQAGHEHAEVDPEARAVFLGQMHGAELPRTVTARTAYRFCRETGAMYRPHPAETDMASRAVHRLMQRRGIEFAPADLPLAQLGMPVVAIFSTGVLEAAARGIPAWVHAPHAPRWVHEFWDRYDMHQVGEEPTPAPESPGEEPAARIARILEAEL